MSTGQCPICGEQTATALGTLMFWGSKDDDGTDMIRTRVVGVWTCHTHEPDDYDAVVQSLVERVYEDHAPFTTEIAASTDLFATIEEALEYKFHQRDRADALMAEHQRLQLLEALPCGCANGHGWWTIGLLPDVGVDAEFDDEDGRWCPQCGFPDQWCATEFGLEPRDPATIPITYAQVVDEGGTIYVDRRLPAATSQEN